MSRVHGRNGRLYVGIASSTAAAEPLVFMSKWSAAFATDNVDVTVLGDVTKTYVAGLPDGTGTFSGFYDAASDQTYTAARDGEPRRFYLYPTTPSVNGPYWFGTAMFDFNAESDVGSAATMSGDWVPADSITFRAYEDPDALDPLLAEAVVLLRASEFTGVDGDDWVNEGTGGAACDGIAGEGDPPGGPVTTPPHYVTTPEPGFEIDGVTENYYYVSDVPAIEPATGSFTVAGRFYWPSGAGSLDNVFSKIDTAGGAMGSGGKGWQIISGTLLGTATLAVAADGGAAAVSSIAGNLASGEHLLVLRVDRDATPDTINLFIDGTKGTDGDLSSDLDLTAAHELILGRGKTQTGRDYAYWDRALTDTEITVDLPAALGV